MDKKKLIIFGAGGGAVKVIKTLKDLSVNIDFLTDNSQEKWNKQVEGITVIEPCRLKEIDCNILIASDYQEEIEKQLEQMALMDRLVLKEKYVMEYLQSHLEEARKVFRESREQECPEKKILIDLEECTEYGGIEIWSYLVGKELLKKNNTVKYIGERANIKLPEELKPYFIEQKISYTKYWDSVLGIAGKIVRNLPCGLIVNRQGQTLIAAALVKRLYPNQLRVLSIIHTDRIVLFRRQAFLRKEIDLLMGVSREINQKFIDQFEVPESMTRFRESPVELQRDLKKLYTINAEQPIKIGYAARITKTQKRVDLLPGLVQLLDEKKLSYKLQIAGEGSYLPKLKETLQRQVEDGRVEIMGQIDRTQMKRFWMSQDLFVNLSEFEGTSLSMLEAMSYGVVPIVTRVSGVAAVIEEGKNGFICEQHDIMTMAKDIAYLCDNRLLLPDMGNYGKSIIEQKCGSKEYAEYIEENLRGNDV